MVDLWFDIVTKRTQECITLVESNLHTWLLNSKMAFHVYRNLTSEDQAIANRSYRTLELKAGDDVWLACRPRIPKVCFRHISDGSDLDLTWVKGGSTALGRTRL
jgi:glutamate/tyrosine decarboxylase-like PLP-dependent enzyme